MRYGDAGTTVAWCKQPIRLIDDLLKALHRVIRATKRTVPDDTVDRAAIIILSSLKENGAVRLSDLASDLALDISTVSRHAGRSRTAGSSRAPRTSTTGARCARAHPGGTRRARPGAGPDATDGSPSRCTTGPPEDRAALVATLHPPCRLAVRRAGAEPTEDGDTA